MTEITTVSSSRYPGSAANGATVTPNDTQTLAALGIPTPIAIYVGATGSVAVSMLNGQSVTFAGVPAGTILPIQVSQIFATGTTATSLVALW